MKQKVHVVIKFDRIWNICQHDTIHILCLFSYHMCSRQEEMWLSEGEIRQKHERREEKVRMLSLQRTAYIIKGAFMAQVEFF